MLMSYTPNGAPETAEQEGASSLVVAFNGVGMEHVTLVGGKNASLGELMRHLAQVQIDVPPGFATTSAAYRAYIEANGLRDKIASHIGCMKSGAASLESTGAAIRKLILEAQIPADLRDEIAKFYAALSRQVRRKRLDVAVRSSATAEDLPTGSFAGQLESFLNVRGENALLLAVQRCFASLFTDRAISYREARGFDHLAVAVSVGVQRMVRSDKAGAGMMFSTDTETGFPDVVVINAAWGLGEYVVKGVADPDEYVVFKPLLCEKSIVPIVGKTLGLKQRKLIYADRATNPTRGQNTSERERRSFVLSDKEILTLAKWARAIEAHYGRPMDIEWAKDGYTGKLYVVQARPQSVQSLPLALSVPILAETRTHVMLSMDDPATAFRRWRLPADGIGLARMELIIANSVKIHPMALARFGELKDRTAKRAIAALTRGYTDRTAYFVDRLAQGVGRLAASQFPRPVILCLSDTKTNEYKRLIGGAEFEPEETDPMIGRRGMSRYCDNGYSDSFALECRAIKQVRDGMGLSNVSIMIPFCRTFEEADLVLAELGRHGLKRGENGLEIYVMLEIASNVLLAEELAERFDGFSIACNELTQLTLGVDRDSRAFSRLFDEDDPAVKKLIRIVIASAHRKGAHVGICLPTRCDKPAFARFLVEAGIDSISVMPDSFLTVKTNVANAERAGGARRNGGFPQLLS